ncbi:hypothetical protein FRC09_002079 [Ceratobasidium sp. 395]|nr:hypothetical protein FRC09_002079 [Ceratobasidium sp. 395]
MPKSSPPQQEGQKKAPELSKQETIRTLILFWSHSSGLEQSLAKIQGTRLETPSLRWVHATEIRSRKSGSIILLQASTAFENTTHNDSTLFREIALDLQVYLKEHMDHRTQNSISAVYLHSDPARSPTLAAQRSFRALWHLDKLLNIRKLSVGVVTLGDSEPPPQDLANFPALRNMIDFRVWDNHWTYPRPQTIGQLLSLTLKSPHGGVYVPPAEPLTKEGLTRTFLDVETEFFVALQEERVTLFGDLQQLRDERQTANNETQSAKQELENLTIQHNSLLQQLNLKDNTEISDIVKHFRGLNDEIDEFSLEVARTLDDELYKRYPNCENCNDPAGLRKLVGSADKPLLLLQSSKGTSVETRQFLELYVGSVICRYLHTYVFDSFYPITPRDSDAYTQCKAFALVYHELRLRDIQMLSAKWRVDTYSTLRKASTVPRPELTHGLASHIASKINAVCGHLFGDQVKPGIEDARLIQLVERALKLNDRIKEEVVHTGDIHTEYFQFDSPYDEHKMKVLDSEPGDPKPSHIVSTCGLGVWFTKAVGGGKEPEAAILSKSIVASEQMYE